MLNETDKQTLLAASLVLKVEARWFYDLYRRKSDGAGNRNHKEATQAYEKYHELNKIAQELDLIAFGNL
jgi:hypothetical protein